MKNKHSFCASSRLTNRIVYLMTQTIPDVMILEDGSSFGFSRSSCPEGLDLKHSLVAIEKLAVFHAASVVHLNKVCVHFNL